MTWFRRYTIVVIFIGTCVTFDVSYRNAHRIINLNRTASEPDYGGLA
jgi:hypothetical protein